MSELNEEAAKATNEAATQPEKENPTEGSFEEMLEESLKSLNTDEKVHGVVVGVTPTEVLVDVGRKQAGYIPACELSADPNVKPEDVVKVGDEMDLLIMRTNDQEGTVMLSKKRLDAAKGWEKVVAAEESQEVLDGVVAEVVKGGVIAITGGVRVFIPASQATASRNDPLDALLKKPVKFRIIEVNRNRRRAVGSIRSVLRDERKVQEEKFWESAEVGQTYTGVVKSLTSYGAFVDLGGVDGMIHISELSWTRIKHPSEVVKVGDTVKVTIKALDREKGKISLTYKKPEDNPWVILKDKYPVGSVIEVKIVGMTTFGAFAQVIPGIDGLIHISQIADHRIDKPQDVLKIGDVAKVKITDIDFDRHRVSLSIRALLEDEKAMENETAEKQDPETEE
jgi:4-hydroxy-3-methylbut-2-enyl diphosphate reductase